MISISKRKFLITAWTIITLHYIFYAEFLIYKLNSYKWLQMKCNDEAECIRILLVADPQIIGNLNEVFHPITAFSQYDSDRYLKMTYNQVYHHVKPVVVVFLGDLMDEGHIATDESFNQYVSRIFNIFLDPYISDSNVKHIWLPGDNDIGGEDTRVTPKKLQRFERAFSQSSIQNAGNVTFFKINRLTSILPVYKREREFYDTSRIFVGLSHIPLMFRPSQFGDKVMNHMQPHVLFTAHEHKSMIINTDALLHRDFHITPVIPDDVKVFEYSLGVQDMYEILIPTCSYRMGTGKIGYGYAIIENSDMKFTVLWSSGRFEYLIIYIFLIAIPICLWFCGCVKYSFCKTRRFLK